MSQPTWKCVGNLGDASPKEYGGYSVYVDQTGAYPPEAEYLDVDDETGGWTLYRFVLEPCTYVDGILSDNKFHPDFPVWFADKLGNIASTIGRDVDDLRADFLSDDPLIRADAWRAIGEHFGFHELDSYPQIFTNRFRLERFARKYRDGQWE